jgi:NADPH:quinone reductase-like Zn-dependent oxidoreductase
MKAVKLVSHGTPGGFEYCDVPDPVPAGDEVLVEVKACGLNRLDLWYEAGELPVPLKLPRIQGGEVAGVVAGLGEDVDQWKVGDRVAIQSNLFCGRCEFCARGEESICLNGVLLGVERDGGFAERVVAPARSLIAIPEGVDFEASAALTLAGSTAMHMLTDRVEVCAGDWVLVIGGASGVGSAAIQIARQLGARVITTGSTQAKRELSVSLGAEFAVDSTDSKWPAEVRRLTGKRGVDIVIEHVGGEVLRSVFTCLARGGAVVTCGATAGREVPLNLWPFFVKQQRLIGSYGRNHADMGATMQWVAEGRLKPVIHKVFSLAETPAAFAALRDRSVLGKVLVKP